MDDSACSVDQKKNNKIILVIRGIPAHVRLKPEITQIELAEILLLSGRTVRIMMKELINENRIIRVGLNQNTGKFLNSSIGA